MAGIQFSLWRIFHRGSQLSLWHILWQGFSTEPLLDQGRVWVILNVPTKVYFSFHEIHFLTRVLICAFVEGGSQQFLKLFSAKERIFSEKNNLPQNSSKCQIFRQSSSLQLFERKKKLSPPPPSSFSSSSSPPSSSSFQKSSFWRQSGKILEGEEEEAKWSAQSQNMQQQE